ncbi:Zn-ribbon domain-containing OB-fold protein [Natronosalvus halobius]|uniref:Zn-ribbon domain-containing OB-fold protein n=1 Tax=Natronosalvus halobius TaxID=2953746 RepID=UPI00209DAEFD|nr:Zn-ribbon domain-containing OB-fold protein [Natronosalvus halobius]USZ73609.1 Zn-ribbon domain-containing OB-fold protein [Natronosalvus halobius]
MSASDPLHWPIVSEYLEHAADGRLVFPVCADCGESHFPPRVACPHCLSADVDLRESAGTGIVYSYTVVHVDYHPTWGERTPYCNALVELDDGPIVFGNVVDCDPDQVSVGAPVTVDFTDVVGTTLPVFVLG